ncbi:ABC transporter ATP-binding protein [Oenococcus sicerae]|uniref:ABC transporter ATP-binding protein n=1 Tax=Oenococcus sicerae TaxID=2203724 RepID=UPI002658BC8B|nr:ABC transporter ATP-binding protein [Oenococcus sicerae]
MIEMRHLQKSFGKKTVFHNFDLMIQAGELLAITGPSGSGKSTLLNILGLIENFDAGEYLFFGEKNIKANSRLAQIMIRDKINYLFQNFALIETETAEDNLMLALKYYKASKAQKKALIASTLDKVGLSGYSRGKIFELSGGEQQRVAIARALIKPGDLVLADEPTGSLDHENRDEVLSLLTAMHKQGKTVIIVTHDPDVAKQTDRVIEIV